MAINLHRTMYDIIRLFFVEMLTTHRHVKCDMVCFFVRGHKQKRSEGTLILNMCKQVYHKLFYVKS